MLLLLDRDGVINQDAPGQYTCSADDWQAIPGSIEAIARLCSLGYQPVVVTNQSGLGRNLFSLDDLEAMHRKMTNLVDSAGGMIFGIFYCPHLPEQNCLCRKPRRGMLDAIERELGMKTRGALLVGDKISDLLLARDNGCQPMLVRTGHGQLSERTLMQGSADLTIDEVQVFDDLAHVAHFLVSA